MRRLVIGLLVLVAVLVAIDYGAAAVTESAVSREMREQIGLPDDPSVRINGFPFLTQALSGHFRSVDVKAERVALGPLRQLEVRAELRDVTAPMSTLLGSGPRTLRIGRVDGDLRIHPNDLERLMPGVRRLRVEPIDRNTLRELVKEGGSTSLLAIDTAHAARLVGTITMAGKETEVFVIAALELRNGEAVVLPRDIRIGDADAPPVPASVQGFIEEMFAIRVNPGSLPLTATPTSLHAVDGVLEVSGSVEDLVLGESGGVTTADSR